MEEKAKQAAGAKAAENKNKSTGSRSSVGKSSTDEFDKLWYSD